jgi:hypothetical protein
MSAIIIRPIPRLRTLPGMLLPAFATLLRDRNAVFNETDLSASYRTHPPQSRHIEAYNRIVEGSGSEAPLSYFYLLAQRAQLELMLHPRYPYPVPGMVHIGNDMVLEAGLDLAKPLRLDVTAVAQPPSDTGGASSQNVVFCVQVHQSHGCIAQCQSTYLARRGERRREPSKRVEAIRGGESSSSVDWTFGEDAGRRYARISGDYNPIHLTPLLARFFGFKKPIVQGMYPVGRLVAAVEHESGRRVRSCTARFKRAIQLPSTVPISSP